MSDACTYVHVSPCGTPYYVGAGRIARARNFTRGKGKYLEAEDFVIDGRRPYIIIYEAYDRSSAFELEKELIARYGRMDNGTGILYNRTDGPGIKEGHRESPSEMARAIISEANRRRVWTPEQRKAISERVKGRKHTDETRDILRSKAQGHIVPAEIRARIAAKLKGNVPWNKGRKCSPIERKAISDAAIARCARQRAGGIITGGWNKGRITTPETKAKISASMKAYRARIAKSED